MPEHIHGLPEQRWRKLKIQEINSNLKGNLVLWNQAISVGQVEVGEIYKILLYGSCLQDNEINVNYEWEFKMKSVD